MSALPGGRLIMRLVSTPLAAPLRLPDPRAGHALADLREAIIPGPGVEALLPALADPDLLVVTTGQQAGLFTGPLYTIHKALSAAALAARLAEQWGRPVRPIFWVAGDDHDHAEAATVAWLTGDGDLEEARLPPRPPDAPMLPMYRERLGEGLVVARERLVDALPRTPHRDWVADWLTRHYQPDQSVAGACGHALAELLAPLGVACLDPTHPVFKRASAPHLLRALRASADLDTLLNEEARRLEAAGHEIPVPVGDGATLVFLEDRLGRDRLVRDGDGFVTRRGGDRYSLAALEELAARDPQRLSANVLLRPVLESALLPTVAYLGGPGELRYFRMTGPVYEQLGVPRQAPLPRWSGMVVEPFVDRILAKFGASIEELLAPGQSLERRVIRSQVPADLSEALTELEREATRLFDRVLPAAVGIDPTLERPVEGARRQVLWAGRDLGRKVLSRLRAREAVELRQVARARTALRPLGHSQERILTVAPFLARHGPDFLAAVREAAADHYAGALEGAASRP